MIVETNNKFGLMGDLLVLKAKMTHNLGIVAATLNNLLSAAQAGEIGNISQADLVRVLTEAQDALNQVSR